MHEALLPRAVLPVRGCCSCFGLAHGGGILGAALPSPATLSNSRRQGGGINLQGDASLGLIVSSSPFESTLQSLLLLLFRWLRRRNTKSNDLLESTLFSSTVTAAGTMEDSKGEHTGRCGATLEAVLPRIRSAHPRRLLSPMMMNMIVNSISHQSHHAFQFMQVA